MEKLEKKLSKPLLNDIKKVKPKEKKLVKLQVKIY